MRVGEEIEPSYYATIYRAKPLSCQIVQDIFCSSPAAPTPPFPPPSSDQEQKSQAVFLHLRFQSDQTTEPEIVNYANPDTSACCFDFFERRRVSTTKVNTIRVVPVIPPNTEYVIFQG